MSDCIFCKIVNGEIPCHKVWEDDDVLAFLDAFPTVDGHTLVIPKKHSENLFEVDEETLDKIIKTSKKIALMLKENLEVSGVNLVNSCGKDAGQEVNHIHFHLFPRFENDGRSLYLHGDKNISKNFEEVLKKIRGEKK